MRLLVCDMAGTIINEKGLVYKCLLDTVKKIGIFKEMNWWHGLDKTEAIGLTVNNFYNGGER